MKLNSFFQFLLKLGDGLLITHNKTICPHFCEFLFVLLFFCCVHFAFFSFVSAISNNAFSMIKVFSNSTSLAFVLSTTRVHRTSAGFSAIFKPKLLSSIILSQTEPRCILPMLVLVLLVLQVRLYALSS